MGVECGCPGVGRLCHHHRQLRRISSMSVRNGPGIESPTVAGSSARVESKQRKLPTATLPMMRTDRFSGRVRPTEEVQLETLLDRIADDTQPPDIASLLGIEGAGAAAYFAGYRTLFPDSLQFEGRNRRPPRDPVNACLSLGYTMVHFEAVSHLRRLPVRASHNAREQAHPVASLLRHRISTPHPARASCTMPSCDTLAVLGVSCHRDAT